MPADLERLTHRLLDAARAAGADSADALAFDSTSIHVSVRGGALDSAERAESLDLGLRVFLGNRQACVSSSDSSADTIAAMVERALAMARQAPDDPYAGLATPDQLAGTLDICALDLIDPDPEPTPQELQALAQHSEAVALATPGISRSDSSEASHSRGTVHLAATNGFSGGYTRTQTSLFTGVIAGDGTGMERDHAGESRSHRGDLPAPAEIGALAAERTLARVGASRPATGAFPVLFDERVAGSLIGHLLSAVNGTAIALGSSWLRDALGARILPAGLSLTEDPLRPRGPASRPFDAEGLATRRREIVSDGVLQGWVLDLSTGRKLGMASTANAARGTSAPPAPSVTNVVLTQGTCSRDDLIAQMGTGLVVTSMIGATINPTTGDYSRGASGFWVENGEIARPVNACTIAGNLHQMLASLVPANDARAHKSRVVPSLLVEGLTLAGD